MKKKVFVVSCQALHDEPLFGGDTMLKMANAAILGGADWIRTSQESNIELLKKNIKVPIIGIIKKEYKNSEVIITPSLHEMKYLISSGIEVVAVDATLRKRPEEDLKTMVKYFKEHKKTNQKIMADCSSIEDIKNAIKLGFDLIGTTLIGYTQETIGQSIVNNDFELLKKIRKIVNNKVLVVEGKINTPLELRKSFEYGADIVVVGTAITRPREITKKFASAIK